MSGFGAAAPGTAAGLEMPPETSEKLAPLKKPPAQGGVPAGGQGAQPSVTAWL